MDQKEFIIGNVKALWKNTSFRNAQNNRAYYYGQNVRIYKRGGQLYDIIDGYGYDANGKVMYHTRDNGWVNTKNLAVSHGIERKELITSKFAKAYIDFTKFSSVRKPTEKDYSKIKVISKNELTSSCYVIPGYISGYTFPMGECEDDTYKVGDKVKIYAPGLFCDGMTGTVISNRMRPNSNQKIQYPNEFEVAVDFDRPDCCYLKQEFIIPKMYVKKIVETPTTVEASATQEEPAQNEEKLQEVNKSLGFNYEFTAHAYKKIVNVLTKEFNKGSYTQALGYILAILKYKATECKNGNMSIYISDDKEGFVFFENLRQIETNIEYPIATYFELAKLDPIE